jgi:hypothetical protein
MKIPRLKDEEKLRVIFWREKSFDLAQQNKS